MASYPPKDCPVCGQRLWSEEKIEYKTAWQYYHAHVHSDHLDFERWGQRVRLGYVVILVVLLVVPAIGVLEGVTTQIVLPFVVSAFISVIAASLALRMIRSKFRDQWNRDHNDAQSTS